MSKKKVIIVVLPVILLIAFACIRQFNVGKNNADTEKVIAVSQFTNNMADHLGYLTVQGVANQVFEEDGYFMMADPGGCCQIPIYVPFSSQQLAALKTEYLYSGTMPKINDWTMATGTLEKRGEQYVFLIEKIEIDNKVAIKRR